MRSLLFVPADSDQKLARAQSCGADALILDLEDSVAPAAKTTARERAAAYLADRREEGPRLLVRINGLASGLAEADLDALVGAAPDAIVLPKAEGGADIMLLSAMIAARDARAGLADGAIAILAIATETPAALFALGTYRGASARLAGLTWGAEDLAAALGAETNRDAEGRLTAPYALARSLCLFGAAAAKVAAIDTVFTGFRDQAGLEAETLAARRDGFTAKLAIHPDQVAVINRIFTPTPEAIARARAVLAAFADAGGAGVVSLDGAMLDLPHLRQAERVIERAKEAGLA
jgi:citrate lyase subunit beta/citryl-CoA lyase